MNTPNLKALIADSSRLMPEERAELLFLMGKIARLEIIEEYATALAQLLPKNINDVFHDKETRIAFRALRKRVT